MTAIATLIALVCVVVIALLWEPWVGVYLAVLLLFAYRRTRPEDQKIVVRKDWDTVPREEIRRLFRK